MLTSNLRNICFNFARALIVLPVALTLSACVVGTKVGDLPEESASAADTMDTTGTDGGSTSGGFTSGGFTSGGSTDGGSTDGKDSSGGPQTDTSDSTGTPEPITGGPGECEGLDEAACGAAPGCWVLHGEAYAFEGCPALPQYLGCKVDTGCSESPISVCRDGTDEVYWRPDGCIPPGFSECGIPPLARCGSCEALTEVACQDDGDLCEPLYGAPHILQQGEMCVDYEQGVFLACAPSEPCEPSVPTVCPIGDPSMHFDVTSGCTPFGFQLCDGGGTPECK